MSKSRESKNLMWRDVKDVYCQFVFYFERLLLALDGWQQKFSGFAYIHRPDKIFNCLEVLQGALECPGWKEIVAGCCSWCMYALTSAEISSFSSNGLCSYCCNWAFFVTRAQEKQTLFPKRRGNGWGRRRGSGKEGNAVLHAADGTPGWTSAPTESWRGTDSPQSRSLCG